MDITIIVAADEHGVIGRGNELPWRLPADLKRFREVTMGKPVVMGRRTFASIGRPLPGRHNIVVTRDRALHLEGCTVVHTLDDAIAAAGDVPEVMVIGGAEIYREALGRANRVHLTRVHAAVHGDAFFPALAADDWREVSVETHDADERNPHRYSFHLLERRPRERSEVSSGPAGAATARR